MCWDAKNRHGLPDEVPFDYSSIAHIFTKTVLSAATSTVQEESAVSQPTPVEEKAVEKPVEIPIEQSKEQSKEPLPDTPKETNPNIPKPLLDLMNANGVHEWDIQMVVGDRGYYPSDTPIEKYDVDFINGCLIGAWDSVLKMITDMKAKEEVPFK